MSTTVIYKGDVITTVDNEIKTLATAGKYLEGNVVITDEASSSSKEPKDVVFIDYDGTIVETYTEEEWENISSLPANPTHEGLIAQGWNWTKLQIDTQLTNVGAPVIVGQMYTTSDGKTRFYITIEEEAVAERRTFALYIQSSSRNNITIDWGDNIIETIGDTAATLYEHTYTNTGDYIVTLEANGNTDFKFYGSGTGDLSGYSVYGSRTTQNRAHANRIKKVELGNKVIGLYQGCFWGCTNLKTITIPSTVTSLGITSSSQSYNFARCYSLISLTLPPNFTSLPENICVHCRNMIFISLPPTLTYCGSGFSYCLNLLLITIPYNVTQLGQSGTFIDCHELRYINLPSLTRIGDSTFEKCYNLCFANNIIMNTMGKYSFRDCSKLQKVTFANSNVGDTLSSYIFTGCLSLLEIIIPEGITTIDSYACSNDYSLISVTIPSTVTTIKGYAFSNCNVVKKYYLYPTTPPTLTNANVFQITATSSYRDCIFYVPYSVDHSILEAYKTAQYWSTYEDYIQEGIETVWEGTSEFDMWDGEFLDYLYGYGSWNNVLPAMPFKPNEYWCVTIDGTSYIAETYYAYWASTPGHPIYCLGNTKYEEGAGNIDDESGIPFHFYGSLGEWSGSLDLSFGTGNHTIKLERCLIPPAS